MVKKKSALDRAADIITKIIEDQLATLPADEAKAKRKELHRLAVRVSPASPCGKPARRPRTARPHRISRSRANTA